MNLKFENDRKHCALQISWKDFGAWLSRHGASLIRGRKIGEIFWKFGNLICSNHLWVPCLIHINTFVEIRRHTHTTLQQVSPKIKTKWVCYNLPAVRAFIVHFVSAFLSSISLLAKLPWLRKLFTVFVNIRQDRVFCEKCPIQLFIIMVVDVGTILFQLKSTVIASIEYIY